MVSDAPVAWYYCVLFCVCLNYVGIWFVLSCCANDYHIGMGHNSLLPQWFVVVV